MPDTDLLVNIKKRDNSLQLRYRTFVFTISFPDDRSCMNVQLKILCIFIIVAYAVTASAQDTKTDRLKKKNLTYYWVGRACPGTFRNTMDQYGFKIECTGCIVTGRIARHNRRVVKEVEKVFGKNWFSDNRRNFY